MFFSKKILAGASQALILFFSLLALHAGVVSSPLQDKFPGMQELVLQEHALVDLGGVLLGLRRLTADVSFLQMLQYYGTPEGHVGPHGHGDYEGGHYPELYVRSLRILRLDPYFHSACLFAAGALAFNLNRHEEALKLLEEAETRDPTFWRYHLYMGAIVYRKAGEEGKVITLLEEAIKYPDCPPMLENILANLHKKLGNLERAAQIYEHMIGTVRDPDYLDLAKQKLAALRKPGIRTHGSRRLQPAYK